MLVAIRSTEYRVIGGPRQWPWHDSSLHWPLARSPTATETQALPHSVNKSQQEG